MVLGKHDTCMCLFNIEFFGYCLHSEQKVMLYQRLLPRYHHKDLLDERTCARFSVKYRQFVHQSIRLSVIS